MAAKPPSSPHQHPLLLNGVLLLAMGLWAAATVSSAPPASDPNVGAFLLVTLGLPLLNCGLALRALCGRRRAAARACAPCALAWGAGAGFFLTQAVLAVQKIGG